jgi:D-mannonate dehydratase
MKFLNTLLIILTLTGCQFIAPNKQKKWESISIKEKRALYEKVNKNKSSYKLQDFINEFGPPIDSIDYKLKFTNEIIEYNGLLAPNVESMKEYENYVKLIDPIRKKLYKKYKYEEETNVYRLRKGYYKAMAQYEFKYKESRQDRLTRIKKMLPNWEDIYIDDQKYSDLYDNTSDNYLSSDLRYQI